VFLGVSELCCVGTGLSVSTKELYLGTAEAFAFSLTDKFGSLKGFIVGCAVLLVMKGLDDCYYDSDLQPRMQK
jgi:hypothetical protein